MNLILRVDEARKVDKPLRVDKALSVGKPLRVDKAPRVGHTSGIYIHWGCVGVVERDGVCVATSHIPYYYTVVSHTNSVKYCKWC